MAQLADIVVDCRHPASLARFWAAVLDGYQVAPCDDQKIARLTALGITDIEDDPTVLLEALTGPRVWFQKVPERKLGRTGCTSTFVPSTGAVRSNGWSCWGQP